MFVLLFFIAAAIVGTFIFASGALTMALCIAALYDRFGRKRSTGGGSIAYETGGILLLVFGFLFLTTDPFYATHAMLIGALLVAVGTIIRPQGKAAAPDAIARRVQVGHYRAALACLAIITVFHSVLPLVR
jgi:hypothetical protein